MASAELVVEVDLRVKGDVSGMALQPGDVVVVQCDQRLSREQSDRLASYVGARVPGHEVLVLDSSSSIRVLPAAAAAELAETPKE